MYRATWRTAVTRPRHYSAFRGPKLRPEIPKANYYGEIPAEAFDVIKEAVADLNKPNRKRTILSSDPMWSICE